MPVAIKQVADRAGRREIAPTAQNHSKTNGGNCRGRRPRRPVPTVICDLLRAIRESPLLFHLIRLVPRHLLLKEKEDISFSLGRSCRRRRLKWGIFMGFPHYRHFVTLSPQGESKLAVITPNNHLHSLHNKTQVLSKHLR